MGYRLAKTLSLRHNVMMIDRNREALERIAESSDLYTIVGNAEDPQTYQPLLERKINLFIAVTDNDEANIISCLIADECIPGTRKIVRLKNNFFANSSIIEKAGISEAVFPIMRTANAVKSLLLYPRANSVKRITPTRSKLVAIRIHYDSTETMPEAAELESDAVRLVGIEREKRLLIVRENETLEAGDLLYFYGDPDAIDVISERLDTRMPSKIRNIVIFGADALGVEIARALYQPGVRIKIIEHDFNACQTAAAALQEKATVINGRYGDHRFFEEEGLKNADMLIASTKNDEENIIKCVEAREYGIERVVAINNEADYYQLMHNLGIVAVRGVKNIAYYAIIEKINSSSIIIGRHFCGNSGLVYARTIKPHSHLITGGKVNTFDHPDCVCMLQRDEMLIPLRTTLEVLQAGDIILAFCHASISDKVNKWIHGL